MKRRLPSEQSSPLKRDAAVRNQGKERPSKNSPIKKFWQAIILLGVSGAVFLIYQNFSVNFCPIYTIVGVPCPSCGMTRSWIELLSGNYLEAWHLHPLFFLFPLVVALILLYEKKNGEKRKWVKYTLILSLTLLIGVWLLRMITMFPHEEPMTWNERAVLRQLWRFLEVRFNP